MDDGVIRSAVDSLFSMTMVIDSDFRISSVSDRLKLRCPLAQPGVYVTDVFSFHRPQSVNSYGDAIESSGSLFLLISRDARFALRGQVVAPSGADSEWIAFLGSPWLSWITENCPDVKVELADFPRHDSQMDHEFYITTQREMVDDLRKVNQALESARLEAERAKEIQSNFFAVMSHEMRTPLNGVISALNLIYDTEDTDTREQLYRVASNSAGHLMSVINYVLDFSKLTSGGMELEPEDFDIRETVHSVYDILATRAEGKGIDLQVDIDSTCPRWVHGDASKIRQILINLAGNAVKFTQRGSVYIRVRNRCSADERLTVVFAVEDTGPGIPEHEQGRIFDAFWTSHSETAAGEANTGLGLNICKSLAELLQGELTFSSTEGKGSVFSFSVDLEVLNEAPADAVAVPSVRENMMFDGVVLLVDDNQTNLMVGSMMLERMGLKVRTAVDGNEAIDIALSQPVDLVLMDISMPGMDGETATRLLRERGYDRPIVALTAHIGDGLEARYRKSGMQGLVHKPINKGSLLEELSRFLPARATANEIDAKKLSDSTSPLDGQVLQQLVDSIGKDNFSEALKLLLSETEQRIATLERAWSEGDLNGVNREAHTVSSSARSFGAMWLGGLMSDIERVSGEAGLAELEDLMAEVRRAYPETVAALKQRAREQGVDIGP